MIDEDVGTGGSPDGQTDASGPADALPDGFMTVPTPEVGTQYQPDLLVDLPASTCSTPDGMRLIPGGGGDIVLSCPNFFGMAMPAPVLMKLKADNSLEPYFTNLPPGPEGVTPSRSGPMGLDFGPDNNLYIADHQYRFSPDYKSRLIRVNIVAGVPTTADVVVEGIRLANAVMWKGDDLFVSDTWAYEGADMGKSAIYRFTRAELTTATTLTPIRLLKPGASLDAGAADPHLFATFATEASRGVNLAGADGITFDSMGNLFTGNFGDGVMTKITFDASGNTATQMQFVKDPALTCVDGIFADLVTNDIYVADSQRNSIKKVSAAGVVTNLWENADSDGTGGLLDQPAEPVLRGNDLIIVNFDAGFAATQPAKNKAHDAPHTISIIRNVK